jgi:glutamine amidotransferase
VSAEIVVVDYGMGNLASVRNAFERLGAPVRLTSAPAEVAAAARLVLPGVGAFGHAVEEIDRRGLRQAIVEAAGGGAPVLGICLGMQLLFDESDESPGARGLGLVSGRVRRLPAGVRVPHVGWNRLEDVRPVPLLAGVSAGEYLYFVHSYHAEPEAEQTAAWAEHGARFVAVAGRGNVWGVQAHPEKSQRTGETILRNFLGLEPGGKTHA